MELSREIYVTQTNIKGKQLTNEELSQYYPTKIEIRSFKSKKTGGIYVTTNLVCDKIGMHIPISTLNGNGKYINGAAVKGNTIMIELESRYFDPAIADSDALIQQIDPAIRDKMYRENSSRFTAVFNIIADTNVKLASFRALVGEKATKLGITNMYTELKDDAPITAQLLGELQDVKTDLESTISLGAAIKSGKFTPNTTVTYSVNDNGFDVYKLRL